MTSLKKFLSLIIMIIVSFSLTACDFSFNGDAGEIIPNTTKLVAPTSIRVENNVVYWNAVENAGSYIVQVGTEHHQAKTSSLEYPISSLHSESFNGLYVKVKALPSSSLLFSESDWSTPFGPINYVKPTKEEVPVEVEWDSSIKKSGIGETINAIDSKSCYISHYSGSLAYKIFQQNALYNIPLLEYTAKTGNLNISEGTTMQEYYDDFYSDYKMKFSSGSSANVEFKGIFSANASTNFGVSANNSTSINRTTKTTEYYYTYSQIYNGKALEIQGYRDINTFRNILSDDFLNDAKEVTNKAAAQQFFYQYGTHLIAGGVWGGRLDASYHIVTDSTEVNSEKVRQIGSSLKTKIGASINLGDESAGADSETTLEDEKNLKLIENYKTNAQSSNLSIKTVGGDPVTLSLSNIQNGIQEWAKTLIDSKYEFIDALDGALIALWDLLPDLDEYSVARDILEEYFKDKCNEDYTNLMQKFYRQNITQEPDGSEEYPFLIYTVEDLQNIKNKGLDKHYILVEDIDLSEITSWLPIGCDRPGNEAIYTPFTGSLNGNFHTINGLQSVTPSGMSGNISYKGLFAKLSNGACIENLFIKNCTYTYNHESFEDKDANKFVGVIAGESTDAVIRNVSIKGNIAIGENGSYGGGVYYVGGIVGRTTGETSIISCAVNMDIYTRNNSVCVGGIVGDVYSDGLRISHSYFTGTLEANGNDWYGSHTWSRAGGIVGMSWNYGISINDCVVYTENPIKAHGASNDTIFGINQNSNFTGAIIADTNNKNKDTIVNNAYLIGTASKSCGNGTIGYTKEFEENEIHSVSFSNNTFNGLAFCEFKNEADLIESNYKNCWTYSSTEFLKLWFEAKYELK